VTLAKTCYVSNMMQDLVKETYWPIATAKLSELGYLNVPLLYWKKIESHLET